MNRFWIDLDKRKFTDSVDFLRAYTDKNPDAPIVRITPVRMKWNEIAPVPSTPKGPVAYVIVSATKHAQIMNNESMLDLWIKAGFDQSAYELRRLSLDTTQGLFRIRIKNTTVSDRLNAWELAGHIVGWMYLDHQEYDEKGDSTDTTIKQFLSGNKDWEDEIV